MTITAGISHDERSLKRMNKRDTGTFILERLQAAVRSDNNWEICRLQERWEGAARESPDAANTLKKAVAWLRQDSRRTAQEAESVFFGAG